MNAEGFTAMARGCRVAAKDTFSNQQGQPVYMLTLIGWGFTRKFINDNKVEFEAWQAPRGTLFLATLFAHFVDCRRRPSRENQPELRATGNKSGPPIVSFCSAWGFSTQRSLRPRGRIREH
jgi:hypothetical protein